MANKKNENIKGYEIDFTTNTLYINYKFAEASTEYGTPEYKLLQNIRRDLPNIKIVKRAGRKQTTCNASKRLTYKNMQDYIMAQDNYEPLLASFMLARIESQCAKSPYAFVRDWFVKQFPNYQECKTFEREKIIDFDNSATQENDVA